MSFRFPSETERVSIVGRTGSGKSQQGIWLLSHRDFDQKPWIAIDFKGDELLNGIEGAHHIDTGDKTPTKPGLYIMHAHPSDEEGLEKHLLKIWENESTGLFVDESYMVPKNSPGFQGILTQGRSKKIPAIVLSQRPAWLSKFVFTEADHFSIFHLNHVGDRKKISEFLPHTIDLDVNPPEFHAHWYDVKRNKIFLMQPVPGRDKILDRFNAKLQPVKRRHFI